MGVSKKHDSRARQKERTRAALVDAARALLRAGTPPTVAEAAEAAKVSRATAYRYFPTQEALLLEAGNIAAATGPVEELLASLPSADPEKRLGLLLDRINPIVLAEEVSMRTALRTYLDTWLQARSADVDPPALREGRRMRWLDRVLEPVRRELTEAQYRRMRAALALTLGMEAMVVMKDVCRIEDDEEGLEALRWAATAMLRTALAEAGAGRPRRAGESRPASRR